jgi:hypothetical protein
MPLLPLLQETANTLNYMLLGYAVLLGLPALYIISFALRRRNLQRDLEMIESLAQDEKKRAEQRARPVAVSEAAKPADRPSRS